MSQSSAICTPSYCASQPLPDDEIDSLRTRLAHTALHTQEEILVANESMSCGSESDDADDYDSDNDSSDNSFDIDMEISYFESAISQLKGTGEQNAQSQLPHPWGANSAQPPGIQCFGNAYQEAQPQHVPQPPFSPPRDDSSAIDLMARDFRVPLAYTLDATSVQVSTYPVIYQTVPASAIQGGMPCWSEGQPQNNTTPYLNFPQLAVNMDYLSMASHNRNMPWLTDERVADEVAGLVDTLQGYMVDLEQLEPMMSS